MEPFTPSLTIQRCRPLPSRLVGCGAAFTLILSPLLPRPCQRSKVGDRSEGRSGSMATLEIRNINSPDETRKFQAHGYLEVVTIGDFTLGKGTFEPGWQWS